MPDSSSHLGLYRSNLTSPAHRRFITVARQQVVEDTLEILGGSKSKRSKHHFLFIGPRGIGKTHLLARIVDEIDEDEELSAAYVVARFPEESNRVLSFADFLLRLCELLRDALPDEPEWADLYKRVHTEEEDQLIVDQLVPHIRRSNKGKKRTILVMLENLHEIFTRQIKKKTDLGAMRKFFMDNNGCLLMATAPLHFDAITDVGQPFFDFFDTQILDSLSEEETIELIRRNLEWDKERGTLKDEKLLTDFETLRPKLLALYRMTGGNPRLTIMLYELIAHDSITRVREQFEILLDRISPFYQDRLNDLPPQERAVLETMAGMRDQEKTPVAIAEQMRMSQPQTSSLLKRLTEARYIRSTSDPKDGRRRLYTIREGFFDLWLGMSVSRGARKRIPYLLDFFSLFYPSREERNRKRAELRETYGDEGNRPDAVANLDHLTEVGPPEERARAKLELARLHTETGDAESAGGYLREARILSLDPVGRWIVDHAEASTDYITEIDGMISCWEQHRSGDLEAFAARLMEMGASLNYKSFSETKLAFLIDHLGELTDPEERIGLRIRIAFVLHELARWREAEEQLRAAQGELSENSGQLGTVLNNLASLLQDTNRLAEAEPLMREALEIDRASLGPDHPNVAIRLNNLSQLLKATNRLAEAEPLMREALEIDRSSFGADHANVARHLNNLGQLLQATNRLAEAEPLMREALEIDRATFGPDHPTVAIDLNNLASLLHDTNRLAEAEPLMREALEIDRASFGADHPKVAIRLNNLASLLQTTNRLAEAEPLMREALEIDRATFGSDHPSVARDLNNLTSLLQATKRLAEAEPLMREALEIDRASFGADHPSVAVDLNNLAQLLQATNRLAEAEPLMRETLEIDRASFGFDHPNVAIGLNNLASLLHDTNRLAEAEPLLREAVGIIHRFEDASGYPHPFYPVARKNYESVLQGLELTEEELEQKLDPFPPAATPEEESGGV